MKGFGIEIKNELLEPKHVDKMGSAIWLYLWLVDHMTSIDEDGIGKVLGGRPVKYEEIEKELGVSRDTYSRWMLKLEKYPYIQATRTPYGTVFHVLKAKKRFRKNATPPIAIMRNQSRDFAESNKTVSVDGNTRVPSADKAAVAEPWTSKDLNAYLNDVLENGSRANQVIAYFWGWKDVGVDKGNLRIKSRKEASALIGRYARTANQLVKAYDIEAIRKKIEILGEHAPFDWQLENVLKYMAYSDDHLTDTLTKMKGRTPK